MKFRLVFLTVAEFFACGWPCCSNKNPAIEKIETESPQLQEPTDLLARFRFRYNRPESIKEALDNFPNGILDYKDWDKRGMMMKFVDFGPEAGVVLFESTKLSNYSDKYICNTVDKYGRVLRSNANKSAAIQSWESVRDLIQDKSALTAKIREADSKLSRFEVPCMPEKLLELPSFLDICAFTSQSYRTIILGIPIETFGTDSSEKIIQYCADKLQSHEYVFESIYNHNFIVIPVLIDDRFSLAALGKITDDFCFIDIKGAHLGSLAESIASFEEHFDKDTMSELISQVKKRD